MPEEAEVFNRGDITKSLPGLNVICRTKELLSLIRVIIPGGIYFFCENIDLVIKGVFGVKVLFEVPSVKEGYGLIKPRIKPTLVFFQDIVTIISGLPVD